LLNVLLQTANKLGLFNKKKKLLTHDQKQQHAKSPVEIVEMTNDNRNVLKRTVMYNESWCFMYDPDTKCQSATWVSPRKSKAQ
jgi:hypothetical protein